MTGDLGGGTCPSAPVGVVGDGPCPIGQKLLDSLAETWDFFFSDVLPTLQAVFYPVQVGGPGPQGQPALARGWTHPCPSLPPEGWLHTSPDFSDLAPTPRWTQGAAAAPPGGP